MPPGILSRQEAAERVQQAVRDVDQARRQVDAALSGTVVGAVAQLDLMLVQQANAIDAWRTADRLGGV